MDKTAIQAMAKEYKILLKQRISQYRAEIGGGPIDNDAYRLIVHDVVKDLPLEVSTEMVGGFSGPDDAYLLAGQCITARQSWSAYSPSVQEQVVTLESRPDVARAIKDIQDLIAFHERPIH